MKILVCVSKTPETTAPIAFTDNDSKFRTDGVNFIMNPYDEWYALVRALELKEANGGTVTLAHVGPATNDVIIRKGLAIGADNAVRIDDDPVDAYGVAKAIAEYAKKEAFDLIFTGKETIDYNGSEVPGMIAELLDMDFVSFVQHLEMEGDKLVLHRQIEGGEEIVVAATPCVVSAAKGLAEQRIPNMRGIMMAKRKPLQVIQSENQNGRARVIGYRLPEEKSSVKLLEPDQMEELIRLLHEEAKVI